MNRSAQILAVYFLASFSGLAAQQPLYKIDTVAGSSYTGDGRQASAAVFLQPQCVSLDRAGNIYISDTGDHRVRRIGLDGTVRTVAGTGTPGYKGDAGPASQAQLNSPYGIAIDNGGNVFIADLENAVVRRVSPDGTIETWVGGGRDSLPVSPAAIAPAKAIRLSQPRDVLIDRAGNLIVADFGGHRVYSVSPGGSITALAGTGEPGSLNMVQADALKTPLAWPSALGVDADGMILIADSGNRRVRRVAFGVMRTVVDASHREIEFGTPTGIATDNTGRIYVADGSTTRTALISLRGDLTSVAIGSTSVAVTPTLDVIAVSERRVRKLTASRTDILAGQGAGDGRVSTEWRFSQPSAVVRDSAGSVWIADTGLGRIRKLTSAGELTTVTSALDSPVSLAIDSLGRVWAGDRSTNGGIYRVDTGTPQPLVQGQNRPIVPTALAFDANNVLYVADASNNLIRRIEPSGIMTVVAGGGRDSGDGQGLQLKLAGPAGIAVDGSGTVWFSESGTGKLRKIVNGRVSTVPGTELIEPRGLRFDRQGNLWVTDAAAHRVVVIEPAGTWYPVAGAGDKGFSGDTGFALAAMLNMPTDVWPEPNGSALIVDTGNDRIRRIEKLQNEPETPSVTPPPAGPLVLSPIRVLHAATQLETDVAPGQLAWVTGKDLSDPQVTISGSPVTIVESSPSRLTIQVPALPPGWVELAVNCGGQTYGKTAVKITKIAPGILTAADGKGQALAINADGKVNGPDNPAERGSVISLFLTGDAGVPPGQFGDIGGYPAEVVWSGPAPGLIGVTQTNIQTPGGFAPSGNVSVTLAFDGIRTQPGVTIVSR